MNLRGFLRWQFAGTLSSPSFWGLATIVLGVIAAMAGCPKPWPLVIMVLGAATCLVDAVRWYLRFSYSIYEMEQNQIRRALERKE